jgi:hypothetical protein
MTEDSATKRIYKPKKPTGWLTQCVRIKRDGTQCRAWAVTGGTLCNKHGNSPSIRAKAAARAALPRERALWTLLQTVQDENLPLKERFKLFKQFPVGKGMDSWLVEEDELQAEVDRLKKENQRLRKRLRAALRDERGVKPKRTGPPAPLPAPEAPAPDDPWHDHAAMQAAEATRKANARYRAALAGAVGDRTARGRGQGWAR